MRVAMVAGELSGDRLGAALIRALQALHPGVAVEGVAGPEMRAAGCRVRARTEELAVMGLVEVLARLPRLLRLRARLVDHWLSDPPDVFLGIDAPDFNLGLERRLKRAGIATLHWVSPSVWAWRRYRVAKIGRSVDRVLTLFPFEARFYGEHGIDASFVGHPLADEIRAAQTPAPARRALGIEARGAVVALLPGSRRSEVERLLPLFLESARRCRQERGDLHFVLPVATPALLPLCREAAAALDGDGIPVTLFDGRAAEALAAADVALLASGTASLECALVGRPMVVAYRMHPLSYALASRLLRVPWVSLPNNLLGRAQVPEFLQEAATPEALAAAVLQLLDPAKAARQVEPFAALGRELRRDAARQVAGRVIQAGTGA